MSGICLRYGDRPNVGIFEFVADTEAEVQDLPTTTEHGKGVFANYKQVCPIGSTCTVGNPDGDVKVYMLFSFGWKEI